MGTSVHSINVHADVQRFSIWLMRVVKLHFRHAPSRNQVSAQFSSHHLSERNISKVQLTELENIKKLQRSRYRPSNILETSQL